MYLIDYARKYFTDGYCDTKTLNEWYDLQYEYSLKSTDGSHICNCLICYLLCLENNIENIWKIWKLKNACYGCYTSIDSRWLFLCGREKTIEETLKYLSNCPDTPDKQSLYNNIISNSKITQPMVSLFWKKNITNKNLKTSFKLFH
jgi:hypothetical protein